MTKVVKPDPFEARALANATPRVLDVAYKEHTSFPWHEGVEGLGLRANMARQAVNCGRCGRITASP